MKNITILLGLTILISSCKKNEPQLGYQINGTVQDEIGNSLQNATLTLFKREVTSGTFNLSFVQIDEVTSNNSGQYTFNTPNGNYESFKINISLNNYFNQELIVNPDNLSHNEDNIIDFNLIGKGYFNVQLKNITPWDGNDNLIFNTINPDCEFCTNYNTLNLPGVNIDTLLTGSLEANKYFYYQYTVIKNNFPTTYNDSVYCSVGDTSTIIINY